MRRILAVLLVALFISAAGAPAAVASFAPAGNESNWADGPGTFAHLATGSQSTGFGVNAFNTIVTGENNTGVGYGAGRTATGSGNTALGAAALFQAGAGSFNVAVGLHAGRYSAGSNNVFLGADSQTTWATGSAVVAVGDQAVARENNSVALGATARAEHEGSVALGQGSVTTAAQQVMVGPRDVEVTDPSRGIILRSPNGTRFRITVCNDGTLKITAL